MTKRTRNVGTWAVITLALLTMGYFISAFIVHIDSYKPSHRIPFTVSKTTFTAMVVEEPVDMIGEMQYVVVETPSLRDRNTMSKVEVVVAKPYGVHVGSVLEVRTLRTYRHPGNDLPDMNSGATLRVGVPITNDKAS